MPRFGRDFRGHKVEWQAGIDEGLDMQIERGRPVLARDALGEELERVALGVPRRGDDFPVVWVCRADEWALAEHEQREPNGVPWPLDDVRLVEVQPA